MVPRALATDTVGRSLPRNGKAAMQPRSTKGGRLWLWLLGGTAGLCSGLHTGAQAQSAEGHIVVMRDVPTRHAFLPKSGEALIVKTAPFGEVWGGISPGKVISDAEASSVFGQANAHRSGTREAFSHEVIATGDLGLGAATLDRGPSVGSGVAGIVGQSLDTGLGALRTGLGQVQSALGSQ